MPMPILRRLLIGLHLPLKILLSFTERDDVIFLPMSPLLLIVFFWTDSSSAFLLISCFAVAKLIGFCFGGCCAVITRCGDKNKCGIDQCTGSKSTVLFFSADCSVILCFLFCPCRYWKIVVKRFYFLLRYLTCCPGNSQIANDTRKHWQNLFKRIGICQCLSIVPHKFNGSCFMEESSPLLERVNEPSGISFFAQ